MTDPAARTNGERADAARAALLAYQAHPDGGRDDPAEALADLLTDLRHLAARDGTGFGDALRASERHFATERDRESTADEGQPGDRAAAAGADPHAAARRVFHVRPAAVEFEDDEGGRWVACPPWSEERMAEGFVVQEEPLGTRWVAGEGTVYLREADALAQAERLARDRGGRVATRDETLALEADEGDEDGEGGRGGETALYD